MAKHLKTSKKSTKRWTKAETKNFLECYIARKHEFLNSRKKRLAFTKILEDMKSSGFDPKAKVSHLEVKIQTLWRTYKAFVENPNQTVPPFMDQMKEIFDNKHNNKEEIKTETMQYGASDAEEELQLPSLGHSLCEEINLKTVTDSFEENSSAEHLNTEDVLAYCKIEQNEGETSDSTVTTNLQHTFKRKKSTDIDSQLLTKSNKMYSKPPDEILVDPDRMFLLSLTPAVKQLTPADNMDFRLYVQQFLKDRLFPSATSSNGQSTPLPATTSENVDQMT